MRKKIVPFVLTLLSTVTFLSCSKSSSGDDQIEKNKSVNTSIYATMQENYYWTIPTTVNNTLDPKTYFSALLNPDDKYTIDGKNYTYSSLYKTSELSNASPYDIGFEYGANLYNDGIFYVIYYVKPNTNAAQQNFSRGWLIESVNNVAVSVENKDYLLARATATGQPVKLRILEPWTAKTLEFTVNPVAGYVEDPVYMSTVLTSNTQGNRIGYIVYNAFTSGIKNNENLYDDKLASALLGFANYEGAGIEYLILDLRYNANGLPTSAQKLGDALVKGASANQPFIYIKRRADKTNTPYNFIQSTASALADKLKKIYIITGVNTGGMSEVFINSLKAYSGADVVVVGEATQGRNMATGSTYIDNQSYRMNIVIGEWTNKDLKSYSSIVPDIKVVEPDKLEPLGSASEAVLSKILSEITGSASFRSSEINTSRVLGSSITNKATDSNLNSINLQ